MKTKLVAEILKKKVKTKPEPVDSMPWDKFEKANSKYLEKLNSEEGLSRFGTGKLYDNPPQFNIN